MFNAEDRYKPMGLEKLPSKRYDAFAPDNDHPGTVMLYKGAEGWAFLKTDYRKILAVTAEGELWDLEDGQIADPLFDLVLACAETDWTVPEAIDWVLKEFGAPDAEISVESIDSPVAEVLAAMKDRGLL